jgi:hypothetical protein
MATFSVNLSVDEWQQVKENVNNQAILDKIDKHQRAKVNQENTITRKNKLLKVYEAEIEKWKKEYYELEKEQMTDKSQHIYDFTTMECDLNEKLDKVKDENDKLKERLSIMTATASTHIQDINDTHIDYKIENDKLKDMIKQLTIGIIITNNVEHQDEIELTNPKSKEWKEGFNKAQVKIYETILKEMNDTDWNEDDGSCKLSYCEKSKTLCFEIMDSDDEEEEVKKPPPKKATRKVKSKK